jgi:hypothetical protein
MTAGLIQVAIALLIIAVLAQSVAYHVLWNLEFFLRNLAVIGALCLVGAEACDPEPTRGASVTACARVRVCACVSILGLDEWNGWFVVALVKVLDRTHLQLPPPPTL